MFSPTNFPLVMRLSGWARPAGSCLRPWHSAILKVPGGAVRSEGPWQCGPGCGGPGPRVTASQRPLGAPWH
eukprot:493160-Hanusia_phi.AAC.1